MEAYVDEVRKLEEHFDGLQMEHIPRAQNDIADRLSKCAALKLPVELGIFVLKLTQPSVTPSTGQSKKRKLVSGDNLSGRLRGSLLRQALWFVPLKQMLPTSFAPASLPGNIKLRQSRKSLPYKQMFPQQQMCL